MKNNAIKNGFAFILWLIIFAQIGCSSEKNKSQQAGVEYLKLPKTGEDTLKISFFSDTILYIPLATKDKSLIKRIVQIWLNDSIILVNDVNNLLMFSRNGEFIRQIGKKGSGPGEHLLIMAFDVISDTIYMSSTGKRSLIRYTLEGTFCNEIPFNEQPVYFSSTANGQFTSYHHAMGKIYIYNDDFSKVDTIVAEHSVSKGRYRYVHLEPFMPYFQKTSWGLLFSDRINDTIWNITNEKKEPAYILDVKDILLPREKQVEFSGGDFERQNKIYESYQLVHLLPFSTRLFIFQKYYSGQKYSAIYLQNTNTKEMKKFNTSFIYDDIVGQQKLSHFIFTSSKEFLVGVLYAFELHEEPVSDREILKEKVYSVWLDQMKYVKEDDNPILVLVKIKKEHNEY